MVVLSCVVPFCYLGGVVECSAEGGGVCEVLEERRAGFCEWEEEV